MEKSANSIKCVCNDENSKNGIKVLDLTWSMHFYLRCKNELVVNQQLCVNKH
jgi:hypothetical protein